jgi:hypothetical protein
MNDSREKAIKEASGTPLVDLLIKVIFEDYVPGVDDEILIKRVKSSGAK